MLKLTPRKSYRLRTAMRVQISEGGTTKYEELPTGTVLEFISTDSSGTYLHVFTKNGKTYRLKDDQLDYLEEA